jgi:hypothetical protein
MIERGSSGITSGLSESYIPQLIHDPSNLASVPTAVSLAFPRSQWPQAAPAASFFLQPHGDASRASNTLEKTQLVVGSRIAAV